MHQKIIKDFFSQMKCSNCDTNFNFESVSVLRDENNYTVVRIECPICQKNFGLAVLGLDKHEISKSMGETNYSKSAPFEMEECSKSIDYDDIIEAHEFYQSLGDDWMKHIPEDKKQL